MSLFSTASPILPDRIEAGNRHFLESLVYENDNHEAGKTGFYVTAVRNCIRQRERSAPGEAVSQGPLASYLLWIRPAYYAFLHRLALF